MRFAFASFLILSACHQNTAAIPPDASSSSSSPALATASGGATSASTASSPTSNEATCEGIRKRWEKELEPFVGQHHSCKGDEDCVCYGGPVCPNALVKTCPGPVRRDIARTLEPFMDEWSLHRCPVIWSPYGCQAKCSAGRCKSKK